MTSGAGVRSLPEPRETSLDRWTWAAEIPWLPDLLADGEHGSLTGRPVLEAFGRQVAMLRALAAGDQDTAFQLRFTASEGPEGAVRLFLLGAARTKARAVKAANLALGALPPEIPSLPLDGDDADRALRPLGDHQLDEGHALEVRRRVERPDGYGGDTKLADPVLLPWTWTAHALLSTVDLLRRQSGRCVLAVHVEPRTVEPATVDWLHEESGRLVDLVGDAEESPLLATALRAYRRWLRDLPQGALHLRVLLAGDAPLQPGLGQLVGADLTRAWEAGGGPGAVAGSFAVEHPMTAGDLDAAGRLLDDLDARPWRSPPEGPLADLLHLFDPYEASTAFRFPVAPSGGLEGVATQRLSALGGGRDPSPTADLGIRIGRRVGGGDLTLSHAELAQHVLVAGLPGFGKTTTIHQMLAQLARADVPFLVLDPAKSDYRQLAALLHSEDRECTVHRLSHTAPALNPLAVPDGVDGHSHTGRVLAAFDASFGFTPDWRAGYVWLGRALYEALGQAVQESRQPTLADLHRCVLRLLSESDYGPTVRADITGSLLSRIEFLATGPAGLSLLGSGGVDWAGLLSRCAVIEMGAFTGPEERSLLFALLLAGLVSYREAHPSRSELAHVTVLEEAHRVLPAGTRSVGAQLFAEALAELRGAGEGLIVAEQAPSMLHPAVAKLTATKLAHRIVESQERTLMSDSMLLDARQADELARLAPGRVIAYTAAGSRPTLVEVERVTRTEDTAPAIDITTSLGKTPDKPVVSLPCAGCPVVCRGRHGLRHARQVLATVDGTTAPPHALHAEAVRATATGPNPTAAAYCLTAHILGARHAATPNLVPSVLRQLRHTTVAPPATPAVPVQHAPGAAP